MKLTEKQAAAVAKLKALDPECELFWDEQMNRPKFIKGKLSPPAADDAESIARAFVAANRELLFLGEEIKEELVLSHIETDQQGFRHVFLGQRVNGLPVFEGSVQVHINGDGEVIAYKDNRITAVDVSTKPQITEAAAVDIARRELGMKEGVQKTPNSRLCLFRDKDKKLHLAWEIEFLDERELGGIYYFVDAHSGQILFKFTEIRQAMSRTTYSAENTADLKKKLVLRDNQTSGDGVAQAAHDHIAEVYTYYFDTFGRDSYDGNGAPLVSTVHYMQDYNNAFWSDWYKQMVYGDGDGVRWKPLALALDIVGHELTHAVTASTARFLYAEEAGALDESFADVFGVMITNDGPIVDWTMGEGVFTPFKAGDALRDLSDPSKYGQPDHMDDYMRLAPNELPDPDKNDNGYVHYNSGIPNKAAYLIVEGGVFHGITVAGIGREKAEQIYYLALTVYLSSATRSRWTFTQARYAMLNACRQLYGDAGREYQTVKNGWAAVGVGEPAMDFTIVRKETAPNQPIPDNDPAGVRSGVFVSDTGILKDITVSVAITHTYKGDLRVTLTSPNGEQAVLHDRQGGSANDLIQHYDLAATPGLMAFVGDEILGNWVLAVSDHARYDSGTLVSWGLALTTEKTVKKTMALEAAPNSTIPDNTPQGIESVIAVDQAGAVVNLDVSVDIGHTWIGDLTVSLLLPSGAEFVLHNRSGGSRHDIKKTYSTKSDAALQALVGEQIRGAWKIKVADHARDDEGTLHSWKIALIYE